MDWRKSVTALTLTGLTFTATMPAAMAFFPPVPSPGEVVTVVPPVTPPPVVVPPVKPVPPPIKPPVKPIEKPECNHPGENPQTVPEPATIIATATGLAAIGGWRLRRRSS